MGKYKSLDNNEKAKIIEFVESGEIKCKKKVAAHFGIAPSTLSTILKNKDDIFRKKLEGVKKRKKNSEFPSLDECVLKWFQQCRANKISISGSILQEKSLIFAKTLGIANFKSSNGWLEKFRKRHGISFRKICGEGASVPESSCDEWKVKLRTILEILHFI